MDIESLWTMRNITKPPRASSPFSRAGLARALVALLLLFAASTAFAMNHVYKGHYTSGSAAWTIEKGHIYQGHYASGSAAWTFDGEHIWKGHYASGSALFSYDGSHLWRGHYTSGSALASWDSRNEIPDGVLAFLATQLLE